MNIRSRSAIHETAQNALDRAPQVRRIILVYTAVCCGLSFLVTLMSVFFSDRISGAGGLGNIGLRSVLSTGQSVLPLIQSVITACLGLGYHIAMLTVTRGYDAEPRTLMQGFRHWGPLIRAMILQGFIYFGICLIASYASSFIFLLSPFSASFMEVMEPIVANMNVMDSTFTLDEATLMAAAETMIPMLWILLAVLAVMILPVYYRFRMVTFCLADNPGKGALAAMAQSRRLLHRNCFALFRLDLSLWWFYLASALISIVCYGDVLLPLLGVSFPWSSTFSFYLFYIISLAMQIGLYYFAMNRVTAVYAVTYDTLLDQQQPQSYPVAM